MMNRTLVALRALRRGASDSLSSAPRINLAPPEVTFQVEVNYVDVDVVVTDEQGNFVSGLAREDFEVFEDGKPQKVDTFAYVEIPVEPDNAVRPWRSKPSSIDTQSNRRPFAGRLYVIVLDDQDVGLDANVAGEEIGQRVRRQVHGRQRRRRGHPYERPNRRGAGVHEQQAAAPRRDRQVHGPPHAVAHDRAARRLLQDLMLVDEENQGTDDATARRRPIPAATAGWSRPISSAASARSACSTRSRSPRSSSPPCAGRRKAVLFFSEGIDYPIHDSFGGAERHRRHPRHAGRDHDGGARQRELLHDRPARPGRHDQRVHGDGGRRRARDGRRRRQCARHGHESPASPAERSTPRPS